MSTKLPVIHAKELIKILERKVSSLQDKVEVMLYTLIKIVLK